MATKRSAKTKTTPKWEITLIRQRGQFLGFVDTPEERAAIEEAIKVFEATNPEQQKRLIARRER
jgi:hypothetical protein